MMMVVGSIKTRQYEKDGQKRTATEVDARDCVALFANKSAQVDAPADKPAKPDAGSSIDDDDIPF
jgi:single-stranded DNA-binding protein